MEWLQSILDNGAAPALTAFILGLLTAISPCPLATNIAAIGFISKNIEDRKAIFMRGIYYTVGRVLAYTVPGHYSHFNTEGGCQYVRYTKGNQQMGRAADWPGTACYWSVHAVRS